MQIIKNNRTFEIYELFSIESDEKLYKTDLFQIYEITDDSENELIAVDYFYGSDDDSAELIKIADSYINKYLSAEKKSEK